VDILVVDDSSWMRAFARLHLQQAGFSVEEVEPTSAFEVLETLHRLRPRVVLTDYEMPACNGETLIRLIREDPVLKDTAVLVMSAHREAELVERLGRWDLWDYLVKPLRPEELVARVRDSFARHPGQDGRDDPGPSA